jgi:hypothetical protein
MVTSITETVMVLTLAMQEKSQTHPEPFQSFLGYDEGVVMGRWVGFAFHFSFAYEIETP